MTKNEVKVICVIMLVLMACSASVGWIFGRALGRAERDIYHANHPTVVHDYNPDGLPSGAIDFPTPTGVWLHPSITFDTFGPGMEGRAWMSKGGEAIYIQGIQKSDAFGPSPKPPKASKRRATEEGMPAYIKEMEKCQKAGGTYLPDEVITTIPTSFEPAHCIMPAHQPAEQPKPSPVIQFHPTMEQPKP